MNGPTLRSDNLRLARIARLTGAPQVAGAGVDLFVRLGEAVCQDQPLCRPLARCDADLALARRMALQDSGFAIDEPGELPAEFVGGGDLS